MTLNLQDLRAEFAGNHPGANFHLQTNDCDCSFSLTNLKVDRRDHAASTPAGKLNRRKFKRHEPRIAAQPFALVVGKCSIGAGGKHQQFLSLLIV